MGCDPTIGDPARVAAWAGSFLAERPHSNDSRLYKDGLSAVKPIITRMAAMGFASLNPSYGVVS